MPINQELDAARQAAFAEAAAFELPEGWQEQRLLIPGITIDSEHTRDRDDAIWLMPHANGFDARISISDVGSFVPNPSAVVNYAEQIGETRYLRTNNIPMIPPEISEGKLSLLDTQETPAFSITVSINKAGEVSGVSFSQDRVNPYRMTYKDVAKLTRGQGETDEVSSLRMYEQFAISLLEQRRAKGAFAFYDPVKGLMTNEDGVVVSLQKGVNHSGELIVQELMILANTAVAEYMWRNNIPAFYRNHHMRLDIGMDVAVEIMSSGSADEIAALKQGFGRARYATHPNGHVGLGLEAYTHWTSPLRRFADFANHANLTAYMLGKDYPYPLERLDQLVEHLNQVQDELREGKVSGYRAVRLAATARSLGQTARELMELDGVEFYRLIKMASETGIVPGEMRAAIDERTSNGMLGPRELTKLIFSRHSASRAWDEIKATTMKHLLENPHDAVSVLSYAQQEGLIRTATFNITGSGTNFKCEAVVRYEDGTEISFNTTGHSKKTVQQHAAAGLIAKVSGQELDQQPARERAAGPGRVFEAVEDQGSRAVNPKGLLQEYFQRQGSELPSYVVEETYTDGINHVFESTVTLEVGDKTLTFTGRAPTKKGAETEAAAEAIRQLDLVRGAPEEPLQPRTLSDNPISALQERSQSLKIALPRYVFRQVSAEQGAAFECVVTVQGGNGEIQEFTVSAPSKQQAKALAAQQALQTVAR